ncbi:MAG: CHAT domain-containing protein [Acidobacteriota bacterium]|nr:CHAT domain-containing protein [Acidobacteriota bacterium]
MVIAGNYRIAGDGESAWRHAHQALVTKNAAGWPAGYMFMNETARTAALLGTSAAAEAFLEELVRVAEQDHSTAEIVDALTTGAEFHRSEGAAEMALNDLRRATAQIAAVSDPLDRRRLTIDVALMRPAIERDANTTRDAIVAADTALATLRNAGSTEKIIRALYYRAVAQQASGDDVAAVASLREAITEADAERATIDGDSTRVASVDSLRPIFDLIVEILLARHQAVDALRWSDRAKARVLADALRKRGASDDMDDAVSHTAHATPNVTYVQYHVLRDRIAVWTASPRRGVEFQEVHVNAAELADHVRSLRAAFLVDDEARARHASMELYRLLVAPIRTRIATERVTWIPDQVLVQVPWRTLVDPATGRRLGEDFDFAVAPSMTWCRWRAGSVKPESPQRIVVVAGGAAPDLPYLPYADAEARHVAAGFSSAVVLNERATPDAIRSAAATADAFHFAGHAVRDAASRGGAALLIGSASKLTASEISTMDLWHLNVVTLAACETSGGRVTSDGALSLARSFLLAGAPTVVSSTLPVDDELAAAFSKAFYRAFRRDGASRALSLATREVCTGHATPTRCWAAFELLGLQS